MAVDLPLRGLTLIGGFGNDNRGAGGERQTYAFGIHQVLTCPADQRRLQFDRANGDAGILNRHRRHSPRVELFGCGENRAEAECTIAGLPRFEIVQQLRNPVDMRILVVDFVERAGKPNRIA